MVGPAEFDGISVVVFDREVDSLLLFDHTVSKVYFVFFFKRKVFKQNILVVCLTFDLEPERFELIQ